MTGCPVEDDNVGILYYRDCIFADCIQQKGSVLKFKGEINGSHASKVQEEIWLPYELIFKNVIKYSSCELDTYEADANAFHGTENASFLILQDSDYLKKIPIRYDYKKYDYKHFLLFEYDFVYNIFAVDYELRCGFSNTRKR